MKGSMTALPPVVGRAKFRLMSIPSRPVALAIIALILGAHSLACFDANF